VQAGGVDAVVVGHQNTRHASSFHRWVQLPRCPSPQLRNLSRRASTAAAAPARRGASAGAAPARETITVPSGSPAGTASSRSAAAGQPFAPRSAAGRRCLGEGGLVERVAVERAACGVAGLLVAGGARHHRHARRRHRARLPHALAAGVDVDVRSAARSST